MDLIGIIIVSTVGFAAFKRYLEHRENMELAKRGIQPTQSEQNKEPVSDRNSWRRGMILAAIGAAITIGFLPLVISEPEASPALIGGLVPLLIGLAMMYTSKGARSDSNNIYEVHDNTVPTHKQHLFEETYDADIIINDRAKQEIKQEKRT